MYFCVVLCIVCFVSFSVSFVCMCTVLLPPGSYQIAVKCIIYHIVTYYDLMFAALGIQNVMRMRHIFICCSTVVFHAVSKKAQFSKNVFERTNIY